MANFLQHFDGLVSNTVFCAWTGSNPMSTQRLNALWSIFNNIHCPVVFLNTGSLRTWERPDSPFHPAFDLLSETHKSDYLRCYLMHHYGGGYTDIKLTHQSWVRLFQSLRDSPALALGYGEIGSHAVAPVEGPLGEELRRNYDKLIGLCAFIFRKQTDLTWLWYLETMDFLDRVHGALKENPARHPQDRLGAVFEDGTVSRYPIRWTELLGNIFHPAIYRFHDQVMHEAIEPIFHSYR